MPSFHIFRWADPWSSSVEGDDQLDCPNSQTGIEYCLKCVATFCFDLSKTEPLTTLA